MAHGYFSILLFCLIAGIVSLAVVALPFFLSRLTGTSSPDVEKLSPYECGFDPIGTVQRHFNIKFYLVAILFVIFDLEIAMLFPWSLTLKHIGIFGFTSMMIFLFILTIGFIYEWKNGALDWS